MTTASPEENVFSQAASAVVGVGNDLMQEDDHVLAIASGMLAGAVQFWLFSRQPCEEDNCEDCKEIATAKLRMKKLLEEVQDFAQESEYYETPNDSDVGQA